jgi:hypothetical protein
MYVMTTNGKIWNSDINSLANWTASAFNTAQSYPDGGCGLGRYKDLIVAFGKSSIEFFQDVGLTPSPIISIGNSINRIGAVSPSTTSAQTVFQTGNTIYFIGVNSETGQKGFYRINGFIAEKVSNPAIDKLINLATITGITGSFTTHGVAHILMYTAIGAAKKHCYCIDTNTWWILTVAGDITPMAIVGSLGVSAFNVSSDAKIYSIYPTNPLYQDAGVAYTQTIQLENMDMGTQNRKIWKRIRPICDPQTTISNLSISYSDDDHATYSTARNIDLGIPAEVARGLLRLGTSRRRSWKLEHNANGPNRMESIEIEYEVCSL